MRKKSERERQREFNKPQIGVTAHCLKIIYRFNTFLIKKYKNYHKIIFRIVKTILDLHSFINK